MSQGYISHRSHEACRYSGVWRVYICRLQSVVFSNGHRWIGYSQGCRMLVVTVTFNDRGIDGSNANDYDINNTNSFRLFCVGKEWLRVRRTVSSPNTVRLASGWYTSPALLVSAQKLYHARECRGVSMAVILRRDWKNAPDSWNFVKK